VNSWKGKPCWREHFIAFCPGKKSSPGTEQNWNKRNEEQLVCGADPACGAAMTTRWLDPVRSRTLSNEILTV